MLPQRAGWNSDRVDAGSKIVGKESTPNEPNLATKIQEHTHEPHAAERGSPGLKPAAPVFTGRVPY